VIRLHTEHNLLRPNGQHILEREIHMARERQTRNFWTSDNHGTKPRAEFYLLPDRQTKREDVKTLVVGGRPFVKSVQEGEKVVPKIIVPWWSKRIPTKSGHSPSIQGQNLLRGTIEKETIGGKERYVITNGDDDPNDYITVVCGLDVVDDGRGNRSPMNHYDKIVRELGKASPWGVIAFDCDAVRLLAAQEGDEDLRALLADPNLGRGMAEKQGKSKTTGKYIPSVDCFEVEISEWKMGPRHALLKGTPWGEVRVIKRWDGVAMSEKRTDDPLLIKLFYRGLAAEKEAARAAALARKKITPVPASALPAGDPNYKGGVDLKRVLQ